MTEQNTILHTVLQWLQWKMNQISIQPSMVRYSIGIHLVVFLSEMFVVVACVIIWLCTNSPLQDCCKVLLITSKHPTHSNTGTFTGCWVVLYPLVCPQWPHEVRETNAHPLANAVCKIGWNHGWSNGPTMMALWVVRSILGGPLKMRVNFKLLHHWHMDFRMFFLWWLRTILLEIDFKQNQTTWKTLITYGDKKSWSPNGPSRWTSRSPRRFIGRLGRPVILHTAMRVHFELSE